MDLLQRKPPSASLMPLPPLLLLLLLCLHLCVGLCWTHSLQQAQHIFLGPIVEGILDNEVKTLTKADVEASAGSSEELLAVDRGQGTESRVAESQSSPHFLESDLKQVSPVEKDNDSDDKSSQGRENEKQMVNEEMTILPFVMVSVGLERQSSDVQFSGEHAAIVMDEAITGSDSNNYPTFEKAYYMPIHGEHRIGEISDRNGGRRISRPFLSVMVAALNKPWQYWNIICTKKGIYSNLKSVFTRAQNHLKNWFSSPNQKKAPMMWSGTEPLAIVETLPPVPPVILIQRMLSILQQVILEYRSSTTSNRQGSCAGNTEEAAIRLREALSSRLKQTLCSEMDFPCDKEFCALLQSHPKLASLMIFSKFGINPVAVALSHSIDTGVCASSTEVSDLQDNIHHVMKLGHHIRETLSSRDLLKKELPTGIKFWKSIFTGNQNRSKVCFHQVLDNVKKVMKHQLATNCHRAKCPKLVSTCSFAKEYKHLVRMLLILKLRPWRFAAHSCAAENSCSSLPNIISISGTAHGMNKRQIDHFDSIHMIRSNGGPHDVPRFPAFHRQACRKAMLFRKNPMGLSPFDLRANRQLVYNPLGSLHLEPTQTESYGSERIFDDFDTIMSMVHKFHHDIPHDRLESNKHALNILDSFHGIVHPQGVEGNLIISTKPENFYTLIDHVLKTPSRENVQLQAAENKSSKSENPEIQSVSVNEASSHAEM